MPRKNQSKSRDCKNGNDDKALKQEVLYTPRTFVVENKSETEALLARLRTFRGRLPADFKFSRDKANACE